MPLGIAPDLQLWCLRQSVLLTCATASSSWSGDVLNYPPLKALIQEGLNGLPETALLDRLAAALGIGRADASVLVEEGRASGLLTEDDQKIGKSQENWTDANWAPAFQYHLVTNSIVKYDYSHDPQDSGDRQIMRGYVAEESPPENYKNIDGPFTPLSKPRNHSTLPLSDILAETHPIDLMTGPLCQADLSWLLWLNFGQTYIRNMAVTGAHVAKCAPSGGSRHPTEAYTLILNVEGVEPGLYHYSVARHGLVRIAAQAELGDLAERIILPKRRLAFEPSVVVLLTSIPERSMFRYRESRSYRVLHYDAGHLMQNFRYLTRAIRRPSLTGYTSDAEAIEYKLGVNGFDEFFIGYCAMG